MNVGILTFHDAHNYGAVLQAYALKKYICDLGYNAKIINYHHYNIPNGFPKKRKIEKKTIKNIAKHVYSSKDHYLRWDKFNSFIKNLIDDDENVYTNEIELSKLSNIDIWISGSDQIWNTDITRGFNKGFFLDFETNAKKIYYAVSMGIPELEKQYEDEFRKSINKVDYISVREDILKDYTEKFTNKNVEKVIDPTLLLDEEEYDDILVNVNQKDKYLLIYALGPDERLTEIALNLAKKNNLKIIEINDYKKIKYTFEQVSNAGPEEFVSLIKNANIVVTNSFHGTIFSIIFEKEFYTITRLNRNARMESILKTINMSDRLITDVKDIENVKKQDYKKAKELLNIEVEKSRKFLKGALQ